MISFTQFAGFLSLLLLSIPVVGSRTPRETTAPRSRVQQLRGLQIEAQADLARGNVAEAGLKLTRGLDTARKLKNEYEQACFLLSLGNCSMAVHRYRKAMEYYTAGSDLAIRNHFQDLNLLYASMRASIYRSLGDNQSAEGALLPIRNLIGSSSPPGLLAIVGRVAGRRGDLETAMSSFSMAIEMAELGGNPVLESSIWESMGSVYLDQNDLGRAEEYLARAFRIRRMMAPQDLPYSYYSLAVLRNAQHDPGSAIHLLNSALQSGIGRAKISPPFLYLERAKAKAASGQLQESLSDFEKAIDLAQQWRLEVLQADDFRVSAEVKLERIYSGFIETGMRLYEQNGDVRLRDRLFEAAERYRAVSMREALSSRPAYTDQYYQLLEAFRLSLTKSLDKPEDPVLATAVSSARLRLSELEARLGLDNGPAPNKPIGERGALQVQAQLAPQAVLFTFHLGKDRSYAWAVTKNAMMSSPIDGSATLLPEVRAFRAALNSGDIKGTRELGRSLYKKLFGWAERLSAGEGQWILSPGTDLWDLPFAALTAPAGDYLAETHAIRVVPSAGGPDELSNAGHLGQGFVAVADPIYNAADPRRSGAPPSGAAEYTSLPGGRQEVLSASQRWSGTLPTSLLTGAGATRSGIRQALGERPSILHFATHVVQHPKARDQVMIALGYRETGEQEYLTPAEVATWRTPTGVVVLSGCGSGQGAALPGVGLMGLTRAWLVSGARAVVATYWPIADDSVPMFETFYKELAKRRGSVDAERSALALQAGQKAMIASGGWRANPKYWASFFVVGRN